MALLDEYNLASNDEFKKRVLAAMVRVAIAVVGEAAATAGRDERHSLGVQVLSPHGFERWLPTFARACASNSTIALAGLAATDGDIEFAITSVWSDVAGVKAA